MYCKSGLLLKGNYNIGIQQYGLCAWIQYSNSTVSLTMQPLIQLDPRLRLVEKRNANLSQKKKNCDSLNINADKREYPEHRLKRTSAPLSAVSADPLCWHLSP